MFSGLWCGWAAHALCAAESAFTGQGGWQDRYDAPQQTRAEDDSYRQYAGEGDHDSDAGALVIRSGCVARVLWRLSQA